MNRKTNPKSAASAAQEARQAIEELRQLRVRKLDQRDGIASRPVPLAEAQAAVDAGLARMAAEATADLYLAPLRNPAGGRPTLPDMRTDRIVGLLLSANADRVADVLKAALAERYGDDPGLPLDERQRELARLDGEIFDCELAEEALVRDCEDAGLAILRREDADPRALLADDTALGR